MTSLPVSGLRKKLPQIPVTAGGAPVTIAELLTLLQGAGHVLPDFVKKAAGLTHFAVILRYPHMFSPVRQEEYEQAAAIAEQVVRWVESFI